MLRALLIGLVAGQSGIAPLAAVAIATFRRELPPALPLQQLFLQPVVTAGVTALAAAEMAGDKMQHRIGSCRPALQYAASPPPMLAQR